MKEAEQQQKKDTKMEIHAANMYESFEASVTSFVFNQQGNVFYRSLNIFPDS